MSLEFSKELIKINQMVGEEFTQTLVENDIIVPDVKPDILRVLQVDGEVVVNGKEVVQDKLMVSGAVYFKILYVPDGSEESIKSIQASANFNHPVEIKGSRQNMNGHVEGDVEHIEFNVLNGRKLNVKAVVSLGCKVTNPVELEMVTDLTGEEDIQVLRETIKTNNIAAEGNEDYILREELEIPSGKPSIKDLLKVDAKITGKEFRVANNKIMVKGNLNVCTLYIGEMDGDAIQFMEHEVPFSEVMDLNGVTEDMQCDLDYNIKEVYYQVKEDYDGDTRILEIETSLNVAAKASEYRSVDVVCDSYIPDNQVKLEKKTYSVDQLVASNKAQTTIKDTIDIPADIPNIKQVYNVITKPYITETHVETDKVYVEGVVDAYILYLADNEENPVYSYKQEIPFRHTVEMKDAEAYMTSDVKVEIDHCSFSMNSASEVEIRCAVSVDAKVISTAQVELIHKAELLTISPADVKPKPSIIIYFVQKGDNLWKIAKKYGSTVQTIMDKNDISDDGALYPGQQLLIS